MLDRSHRFHGLHSLTPAYKYGKIVRGGQLSLRYMENPRRDTYRVAVVVSKKVDKSAVVRNRIRRRMYEALRLQLRDITQPYDLIVSVFSNQFGVHETAAVQQQVADILRRAGVVGSQEAAGHGIVNQKKIREK